MNQTPKTAARRRNASARFEALELRRLLSSTSGALDTTFGQHGQGVVSIADPSSVTATVVTAGGKILTVGSAYDLGPSGDGSDGTGLNFALARFNADGSPDASFGNGGAVTTDFAGGDDEAYCAAVGADGKIVVGGYSDGALALVRYNADGSLDGTFGRRSKVTLDVGTEVDGVAVLADGRVIASGETDAGIFVARFNADGSLDTTFGQGGVTTIDDPNVSAYVGVRVLRSGRILLVGSKSDDTGASGVEFTYFNSDGSLLAQDDGPTSDYGGWPTAFTIGPDGRVLVLNAAGDGTVQRFNVDGTLDASFGDGGTATLALSGATGISTTADGKIVVTGQAGSAAGVERLTADGSADGSFGIDGVSIAPHVDSSAGVVTDAAGDVIVTGVVGQFSDTGAAGFSVTRFAAGVGVTPATARVGPSNLTAPGQNDLLLHVTYASSAAIDTSTLDDGDVTVTDSAGDDLTVSFQDFTQNADGSVTANYDVESNSGHHFTYRDDGAYGVSINEGEVLDVNGVPVSPGTVGSFRVAIAPPPASTPAPSAVVSAQYVTTPATVKEVVTVTYAGHDAIDDSTIGDLNVDGPDGTYVYANQTSLTDNPDGSVTVAYELTKSDGSQFTPADNGKYTLSVDPDFPVTDNDGTPLASNVVGSFRVMVAPPPGGSVAPGAGNLQVSDGSDAYTKTITVTYTGASAGIAQQTLDDHDLSVTGSDGYTRWASFQSATTNADGSVTATYTVGLIGRRFIGLPILGGVVTPKIRRPIFPVGGGSGPVTFTVAVNAGQVSDTLGSTVAAGTLGTFTATVPTWPIVPVAGGGGSGGVVPLNFAVAARGLHRASTNPSRRHHHRHRSPKRSHVVATPASRSAKTAGGAA